MSQLVELGMLEQNTGMSPTDVFIGLYDCCHVYLARSPSIHTSIIAPSFINPTISKSSQEQLLDIFLKPF